MSLRAMRSVAAAVEIRVEVVARWRAGDLDRMVSARHSRLAEVYLRRLVATSGWTCRPEVSFAVYGERGSIDLLAWHERTRTLLVIELKTEIVDVGEILATLDRKARLARGIASDLGWHAERVSVALVVAEGRTNRRRIAAHAAVFRAALPDDGRKLRHWLLDPVGHVRAMAFVSDRHGESIRTAMSTQRRVRARARGSIPPLPSTNGA